MTKQILKLTGLCFSDSKIHQINMKNLIYFQEQHRKSHQIDVFPSISLKSWLIG